MIDELVECNLMVKYLVNLLCIVWYNYTKMCERIVECDDIMVWCIFSFTWNVRNRMLLLNYMMKSMLAYTYMLIDCDIDGEYIYVNWLWYCRWLHICQVLVTLMVIAYMLNNWWWCGELFVWTYALCQVICSCIHDWWWLIFISKM